MGTGEYVEAWNTRGCRSTITGPPNVIALPLLADEAAELEALVYPRMRTDKIDLRGLAVVSDRQLGVATARKDSYL